jgi:hypothetical protein
LHGSARDQGGAITSASTNAASQSEDGHDQECDPSSSEDIAELAKKGLKSGAI